MRRLGGGTRGPSRRGWPRVRHLQASPGPLRRRPGQIRLGTLRRRRGQMRLGTLRGMIDLGIPLSGSEHRTKAFAQAELHFIIIVQYADGNII